MMTFPMVFLEIFMKVAKLQWEMLGSSSWAECTYLLQEGPSPRRFHAFPRPPLSYKAFATLCTVHKLTFRKSEIVLGVRSASRATLIKVESFKRTR